MTENEILLDWLDTVASRIEYVLKHITPEALHWRPDSEANSIMLTVWHVARAWDILAARILGELNADEELWHRNGWKERTGYDPRGKGWGGFGNLSGYDPSEVALVPRLSGDDLIAYFDQTHNALRHVVEDLKGDDWRAPKGRWSGREHAVYDWVSNFVRDAYEHLGEIKAIAAMWERRSCGESTEE